MSNIAGYRPLGLFCVLPPRTRSSVAGLGPIRDARSEHLAGMHAIGGILGHNNPGTDAEIDEWLIRSVFKEEQVHAINSQ